jgi:hypothetical protein
METNVKTDKEEINFFALGKIVKGEIVFLYDIFDHSTQQTTFGPYDHEKVWTGGEKVVLENLKKQFYSILQGFQVFKVTKEVISTVKVEKI